MSLRVRNPLRFPCRAFASPRVGCLSTASPVSPVLRRRHAPSNRAGSHGLCRLNPSRVASGMAASGPESLLMPALLRDVRNFWFEHLAGADSLVLPSADEVQRWFAGGAAFDDACV